MTGLLVMVGARVLWFSSYVPNTHASGLQLTTGRGQEGILCPKIVFIFNLLPKHEEWPYLEMGCWAGARALRWHRA